MNNKKTAPIFSLVPRDLGSIQVVRCTSTRRTFVRTFVRTESLQQQDAASYLSSTGEQHEFARTLSSHPKDPFSPLVGLPRRDLRSP